MPWVYLLAFAASSTQEPVDFDRQIRPLLADQCLACHGPDESGRKADLRLDRRESATQDRGGYAAVVPGSPGRSELYRRITSDDPGEAMPPAGPHADPLDPAEIALVARWIEEGAAWSEHWSLVLPERPATRTGAGHPIDQLVRARLVEEGREPAPRAAVHTLARRLAFDLTGLPPDPADVRRLRADDTPEAWGAWIDELLASTRHAERMSMWWLDGARYSDTDGFQQDAERTSWPWRDWVVDSFEANMPFDQFTIEQVAGDLLPDATESQRLATSFHRNHMANGEGGRIAEESRIDYVRDRVNTTGTLWLGMTLSCAQCHDHKFDPVSQRDYYKLAAYFDSIDESGAAGAKAKPVLAVRSRYAARALEAAQALAAQTQSDLAALRAELLPAAEAWIEGLRAEPSQLGWSLLVPARMETREGSQLDGEGDGSIRLVAAPPAQDDYVITAASLPVERVAGLRLEVLPRADGTWSHAEDGEFLLTGVKVRARRPGATTYREASLVSAVADVEGTAEDDNYRAVAGALDDDPRTGWTTRGKPRGVPHVAVFALGEPLVLEDGEELEIVLIQRSLYERALMGRFRLALTSERGSAVRTVEPTPGEQLAKLEGQVPGPALRERLVDQFLEDVPEWRGAKELDERSEAQLRAAEAAVGDLTVQVLAERSEPRTTHVLVRGVWDSPGEVVSRGVPSAILARHDDQVPTRLELARWLVDDENPLTARAIVNQLWQLLFGAGLVPTADDLGVRGVRPAHAELLDWLAVEFVESGWDVRHVLRTIVTSATYQQTSRVTREQHELDPDNRLLSRGARFRMPSWMLRDGALAASGLLNEARGGPPVFPDQPPGLWADQFMGRLHYQPTLGPEQFRRTLYAFWRRNSPPAFLFDTAMRRECEVAVRRTNTPLHALTLLNDRTYLEASRTLAAHVLPGSTEEVVRRVFEAVLLRLPDANEAAALASTYESSLAHYRGHPKDADELLRASTPEFVPIPAPSGASTAELAAASVVASLVFNLDEAVTRE